MSRCSTLGLVVLAVGGGVWFDTAVEAQVVQQSMFVSVIRGGEPVLDMTADEFIVEEDGQAREVLRIERADVPMQVAILVDDSQGLAQNLSHVRNGLRELIDKLPDGQQIALITFGDHMTTVVDYTTSKERLKAAATQYVPFSETSSYLMNAVAETAVDLDRRGAIRPIIVLVTSEGANSSTSRLRIDFDSTSVISPRGGQGLGYKLVLDVLREHMVAVHTLVVRGFGDLGTPQFARIPGTSTGTRGAVMMGSGDRDRGAVLEQLPKVTGGGREELGATSALSAMLTRVANEISNQYLLTYARPVGLIPPEEIEVKVTRRRHQVRGTPSRPIMLR